MIEIMEEAWYKYKEEHADRPCKAAVTRRLAYVLDKMEDEGILPPYTGGFVDDLYLSGDFEWDKEEVFMTREMTRQALLEMDNDL